MCELTTRERILCAAFELIAYEGKDGLTTRKVTEKAGVGKGTLYHHFANMEALLIATLDSMMDQHMAELFVTAGDTPEVYFEQFGVKLINHIEFHKTLGNGVFSIWETILNNPTIKAIMLKKVEGVRVRMGEILLHFYPHIPQKDLEECVVMLFAMTAGIENILYLDNQSDLFMRMWSRFTRLLIFELKSREV